MRNVYTIFLLFVVFICIGMSWTFLSNQPPGPMIWPPMPLLGTVAQWAPVGGQVTGSMQLDYGTAARVVTNFMNRMCKFPNNATPYPYPTNIPVYQGFIGLTDTNPHTQNTSWPTPNEPWAVMGGRPDPLKSLYICTSEPMVIFEDKDYIKVIAWQLSVSIPPTFDENTAEYTLYCDWVLTESKRGGIVDLHYWIPPDPTSNGQYTIFGLVSPGYRSAMKIWQVGVANYPVVWQTIERYNGFYHLEV